MVPMQQLNFFHHRLQDITGGGEITTTKKNWFKKSKFQVNFNYYNCYYYYYHHVHIRRGILSLQLMMMMKMMMNVKSFKQTNKEND